MTKHFASKIINSLDPNNIRRNTTSQIADCVYLYKDSSGITYELNLNEHIEYRIFMFGFFDNLVVEFIPKYLEVSSTLFIDIGANIGSITIPVSKLGVETIAVEPNSINYSKLMLNIALNNSSATVIKKALVAKKTEPYSISLYSPPGNYGATSFKSTWNPGLTSNNMEVVETSTFDDLFGGLIGKKIFEYVLIKIDVEGMELDVIEGAGKTIYDYRPLIIMEWRIDRYEISDRLNLTKKIKNFNNYKIYAIQKSGDEILLSVFDPNIIYENILIIPQEKIESSKINWKYADKNFS
jgi:FkbM family methyltransferase